MSKPVPKPRPPPKPDISALSKKPPIRPKPRRVPPPAPLKGSAPPPRPNKPAHLSKNTSPGNNNEDNPVVDDGLYDDVIIETKNSKENEIEEDNVYDDVIPENSKANHIEEDNLYEDVETDTSEKSDSPTSNGVHNKPPPPRKPLPTLPTAKTPEAQKPKDSLSVRPIPASRTSPHTSPLHSPKINVIAETDGNQEEAARATDPTDKDEQKEQKEQKPLAKPQKPPKPLWLQANSKLNNDTAPSEGPTIDQQGDVENVLYSDKLIIDIGPLTGDDQCDAIQASKPIRKRMATRRQNPGSSTTVATSIAGAIKRRPPPPQPPESEDDSSPLLRSESLKGPSIPKDRLSVNNGLPKSKSAECIPKTAEEQSLYSYAYEHTSIPVSIKSPTNQSPVITTQDDNSYAEPDAAAVAGFMDEIKNNTVCVSDGTYEVPEKEIRTDDFDTSHLDDEHDYMLPCDSPPPIPSHQPQRTGSYDVTTPGNDDTDDEDEDEDEDDDGDYCEPPDAQGPCSEDSEDDFSTDEFHDDLFLDDESSVDEPLYQVYTARTLKRDKTLRRTRTNSNQTDTTIEDITKGTLRNMRMLWCELPEVVSSGILETIDANERKRQEAMFEVMTSEASYLKSLKILENHFIKSNELTPGTPQSVVEKAQHHILFSNVSVVVEISQRFLDTLRQRSSGTLVVSSISDIIAEFASKYFEVYVKYCSGQIYLDRVLKDLRKSSRFIEGIERLEKSAVAQCLSLQSFLVLPMQRITRLPLLVDAICHRCEPGSDEFTKTDAALKAVHKVVRECNEGARKMERMEEMLALRPQIEFTGKPIALVSANRWLLRRGEIVLVIEQFKSPISKKKLKLKPVYMFLFNDLLLITKKKGENRYRVLDYAYRNMTRVEESRDTSIQLDYMLSLILLENSNNKTKDFLLCAESETDKTRWLEAFNPLKAEKEGEKVYGEWDCPQVQAIHDYTPQQPDELALHEGDVINVQRKLPDGWHCGERLCDGVCGWFPANYTENILNEHVRSRNLLQRYRLLAASMHLIGAVQTMKTPKTSKLTLKSLSSTLRDPKRDTFS